VISFPFRTAFARSFAARRSSWRVAARPAAAAELLEERTLLTAYVVDTLSDAVAADGKLSLREAVQAAGSNAKVNEAAAGQADAVDAITFDAALAGGTITLGGTQLDLSGAVTITGLGADRLSVSAADLSRVVSIASGATARIEDLTLTAGRASSGGAGGVVQNAGNLTLDAVAVTGGSLAGTSLDGGGIGNLATMTITRSTISGNTARDDGGGIYNVGILTISDSVLSGNDATFAGSGGGIYNALTLTVTRCVFTGNRASEGGGLSNYGASATVVESTFNGNTGGWGGAVHVGSGAASVAASTISGNAASGSGGGIAIGRGSLTAVNVTISGNSSGDAGGGLITNGDGAAVTFRNVTVYGNRSDADGEDDPGFTYGGGLYIVGGDTVTLYNTLLAANVVGLGFVNDVRGTVAPASRNNFASSSNYSTGLANGVNGNIVTSAAVVDPVLRDNGGPTMTHALLPWSLAANAGADAHAIDAQSRPLAADQRGSGFARVLGGAVDIGAFESDTPPRPAAAVVDLPVDEDDGDYSAGDLSLREAVRLVATGGTVSFAPSLAGGTIILTQGRLSLPRDVSIVGLGADALALSGNDAHGVLAVEKGAAVSVTGLTFTGARAVFGTAILSSAVENFGTLTLSASVVSGNAAGGLYNHHEARLDLAGVTVTGNANGVYNAGSLTAEDLAVTDNRGNGVRNYGTLTATRISVTGNVIAGTDGTKSENSGAGVQSNGILTLTDFAVSGNSAGRFGGGLYIAGGTASLASGTASGNSARLDGGGVFNAGRLTMANVTVSGNAANGGGGGLFAGIAFGDFDAATLRNVTIFGNRADADGDGVGAGGGIRISAGAVILHNTLVAGNVSGAAAAQDIMGALDAASSHNLIADAATAGGLSDGANGNVVGVDWRAALDPVLRDNGGPTPTHAPLPGSAVVDAGSNAEALAPDGPPLASDQRGAGFPRVLRGTVDIGAFELPNSDPAGVGGSVLINEHGTASGNGLADITDADEDALTVSAVNGDAAGVGTTVTLASGARLRVNADGTYVYDPNGKFVRLRRGETAAESFTYTVSDGRGGYATATVTVTVEGGGGEDDLIGYSAGDWHVAASNGSAFTDAVAAQWASTAWDVLKTGDFDGDGRTDVLGLLKGEWYVGLARTANAGLTYFAASLWGRWNALAAWEHVLVGDVDGDGKDDVVAEVGGGWYGATSTGSAFAAPRKYAGTSDPAWHLAALADVTGDGKDDLVLVLKGDWYVGVSTGSTFGTVARGARMGPGAYQLLTLADMNGDGKDDAVGFAGGVWWIGTSSFGLPDGVDGFAVNLRATWADTTWIDPLVGDFDGDGRPDLAARYGGQWYVGLSDASGGERSRSLWASWNNLAWQDVRAGDFDGDGRLDIAGRYAGQWYVARSTGSGFATSLWGRWKEADWRAVAAVDADGMIPPTSAAPPSTLRVSRFTPAAAPMADDEPLAAFWSQAEKDEELATGLLTG